MTVPIHVTSETLELTWRPDARLAVLRFAPEITLGMVEGALLVDSLTAWIGTDGQPFGLLADTKGVRGADSAYRVRTRDFFEQHRKSAFVAVTNMGPVISVVADLFRIGTGIQLKSFADDANARGWLRAKGITA
jgi:hypothetical protein